MPEMSFSQSVIHLGGFSLCMKIFPMIMNVFYQGISREILLLFSPPSRR